MSVVGDNIKKRRSELGYSAETLAEMIGMSPSTVYRYENGEIKKVNASKLNPIARALKTTPADLMEWRDPAQETQDSISPVRYPIRQAISEQVIGLIDKALANYATAQDEAPKTTEARILARGVDKLPEEQRKQALAVVKAMLDKFSDYFDEKEGNDNDDTGL